MTTPSPLPPMPSRRRFLALGTAGAVAVAGIAAGGFVGTHEHLFRAMGTAASGMVPDMTRSFVGVMGQPSPALLEAARGNPVALFDDLLQRHWRMGADGVARFDYAGVRASDDDRAILNALVEGFAAQRPSSLTRDEAFAYWANLYNAVTLKVVVDAWPVASIKDIRSVGTLDPRGLFGPWRGKLVTVEGQRLSLDDIEHGIMRPTFKDPRVHYAVNCASIGCPNLKGTAFRAATLEADLEAGARAYVNHPRGITVLPTGTLKVSSIYRWFIADFGGDDAGILAHVRRYATGALAAAVGDTTRISEDGYDWSINATGGAPAGV